VRVTPPPKNGKTTQRVGVYTQYSSSRFDQNMLLI
jgi:hypothetical protein